MYIYICFAFEQKGRSCRTYGRSTNLVSTTLASILQVIKSLITRHLLTVKTSYTAPLLTDIINNNQWERILLFGRQKEYSPVPSFRLGGIKLYFLTKFTDHFNLLGCTFINFIRVWPKNLYQKPKIENLVA